MRAMILAAGRGERMRPLSDHTPKPLLQVRGRRLIEWHLLALAAGGVREVLINCAWLEEQFPATLGDGSAYGLSLHYSLERRDHGGALETAGGIAKALPWLCERGDEAFWVISGDVFMPEFRCDPAAARAFADSTRLAHLWMTHNPPHKPGGDFGIGPDGLAISDAQPDALPGPRYTWTCAGLFRRALFADVPVGTARPLRPQLELGIAQRAISAELFTGLWRDVGTPQRLAELNA
ncbi:nucleotidyltransferase family protein [Pelomonas sp. CA6]|uniref:nucleotidyltransferase family protein n=1 Tax=Pelomonas sp. CA6 TaxID=2907999 RepID=UPI001F4C5150|nr:nucleotidyltransferase family protein [Pelomonas sp. CA6]MCH7343402.1 nucleotidyltransferase family protein [Pelomonas sp. CA6]